MFENDTHSTNSAFLEVEGRRCGIGCPVPLLRLRQEFYSKRTRHEICKATKSKRWHNARIKWVELPKKLS